jgi:hypothetical protein
MNNKNKIRKGLLLLVFLLSAGVFNRLTAQDSRWLRVNQLQTFFSDRGAEVEGVGYDNMTNYFSWPAEYGLEQTTTRHKCMWIGSKNFYDPKLQEEMSVKVVGIGPRETEERKNMIFEQGIQLVGKFDHPTVVVDDQLSSVNTIYDVLDKVDDTIPSDRMIVIKINTSIGVSVTKKVLAFSQQNHQNYYIYDIVFKNTGIYDREGHVYEQTLKDVYFYFEYRYAFSGESVTGWSLGWGANESSWGASTLNHAFGADPTAADFEMRAFYSWYAPATTRPVSYAEDWGCPNQLDDGVMSSAKYAGCVTLHADKSVTDRSDNLYQPTTTWFISGDLAIMSGNVSQYDELFMQQRYDAMKEGHPAKQHDEVIGEDYPQNYENVDPMRNIGGGTAQGQGFGPYTLAPGDSVRLVVAEGVSGIDRQTNRLVGGKWLQYYNGSGTPTLNMPDGTTTTDHNAYKRAWVETGVDSIKQTYRNALANYRADYKIPQPPPPPTIFNIKSGGDRIRLTWTDNADNTAHFDGYVIYRSEGNVMNPKTFYEKIFECDAAHVVHQYDDTTAVRGFNYYYYIQSKDDGMQNDVKPGQPLYSSMFWTVTSTPAFLRRPAGKSLAEIRVVPNPYDIRARALQFGDQFQYDRLAFYGLPPVCSIKIFTERGDLVWQTEHNDGSGDELWDSLTSSGQIIVSGIYIAYFSTPEGESVYRKFVVIR